MSEDLTKKLPTGDDNVAAILQNIDSRLTSLEQQVEERLYDTRPIWQKVVADIAQLHEGQRHLEEGQRHLEEGQTRLQGDLRDIKISLRDVTRSIGVVYETAIKIQAECRDLNHRVLDIELEQQKQRNSQT
jgi:chromosome segregation ATPase